MRRKHIKIVYKDLLSNGNYGLADCANNTIEVHNELKGKKEMEIILHESMHITFPFMAEESIENAAIMITNLMWKLGYRKTDNLNTVPLQDGKK